MKRSSCLIFVIIVQLVGYSQTNNSIGLTEKRWKTSEILGKEISTYESIEEEAFVYLDSEGNLSGSTSCNTFNGSYNIDGKNVTLEVSTMTKMMCYDSAEIDFLEALRQTTKFSLEGQNLYLLNPTKVVMKLTQ